MNKEAEQATQEVRADAQAAGEQVAKALQADLDKKEELQRQIEAAAGKDAAA